VLNSLLYNNQEDTDYQVNHLLNVSQRACSCGIWKGYGIPCADAMIYYKEKEEKMLAEIMDSDAVSEFHKYPYYHELMKRKIEPVILDNLVSSTDVLCIAPVVVERQAGRPPTKRLRMDKSRFGKVEESTIVCSICNKRGHNKRTCLARERLSTAQSTLDQYQFTVENITLPTSDLS
jgi:hypothetical protein